jgi:hypothetical protein
MRDGGSDDDGDDDDEDGDDDSEAIQCIDVVKWTP